ncbi:hypothetical protein PR048_027190 [Dryococelus australis]|uniref:Uncharacterized protein n=1 Tax=Dryococelus australis TaxID=614101 RepID=A0ABQ9GER5_9NEOP|nr:hypothetical protein PR048_027190 [Dryococelus australis]
MRSSTLGDVNRALRTASWHTKFPSRHVLYLGQALDGYPWKKGMKVDGVCYGCTTPNFNFREWLRCGRPFPPYRITPRRGAATRNCLSHVFSRLASRSEVPSVAEADIASRTNYGYHRQAVPIGPLCFLLCTVQIVIDYSRATMQWYADNNVRRLDWPYQIPDLNPIESRANIVDRWMRTSTDVTLIPPKYRMYNNPSHLSVRPSVHRPINHVTYGPVVLLVHAEFSTRLCSVCSVVLLVHAEFSTRLCSVCSVVLLVHAEFSTRLCSVCSVVLLVHAEFSTRLNELTTDVFKFGCKSHGWETDGRTDGRDGLFSLSARLPPRRTWFDPRSGHSGFLYVGIVPDDAVGRRVFSGISRFPRPFIPALLHTHLSHPHRLSRSSRTVQISSLTYIKHPCLTRDSNPEPPAFQIGGAPTNCASGGRLHITSNGFFKTLNIEIYTSAECPADNITRRVGARSKTRADHKFARFARATACANTIAAPAVHRALNGVNQQVHTERGGKNYHRLVECVRAIGVGIVVVADTTLSRRAVYPTQCKHSRPGGRGLILRVGVVIVPSPRIGHAALITSDEHPTTNQHPPPFPFYTPLLCRREARVLALDPEDERDWSLLPYGNRRRGMEQRRNASAGGAGLREDPPTSGIVLHDYHMTEVRERHRLYTQCDEKTALQFRAVRLLALAYLMREAGPVNIKNALDEIRNVVSRINDCGQLTGLPSFRGEAFAFLAVNHVSLTAVSRQLTPSRGSTFARANLRPTGWHLRSSAFAQRKKKMWREVIYTPLGGGGYRPNIRSTEPLN